MLHVLLWEPRKNRGRSPIISFREPNCLWLRKGQDLIFLWILISNHEIVCVFLHYKAQRIILFNHRKIIFLWSKNMALSFRMQENTSLQLKNFTLFWGNMPPDPPRREGPAAFPILCPGVIVKRVRRGMKCLRLATIPTKIILLIFSALLKFPTQLTV